jgi:hypothetical protein
LAPHPGLLDHVLQPPLFTSIPNQA